MIFQLSHAIVDKVLFGTESELKQIQVCTSFNQLSTFQIRACVIFKYQVDIQDTARPRTVVPLVSILFINCEATGHNA